MDPYTNSLDTLDVIISVAFVRGIVMSELSKRDKGWQQSELDVVKVVISAFVPSTGQQSDRLLTSLSLSNPKVANDVLKYNAIFPLKASDSTTPTRIVLPGLIKRETSSQNESESYEQYKRQKIELLITLMYGNEAITLGKTTMVVTGEEFKTKQFDLHIETEKKSVASTQKKVEFPMKRVNSLSSLRGGEIAPTAFKHDRRRRKWQIEKDAVMRVFMKVVQSKDQYDTVNTYNQGYMEPISRNPIEVPRTIISNTGYYEPELGSRRGSKADFGTPFDNNYAPYHATRSHSNLRLRSGSFQVSVPNEIVPDIAFAGRTGPPSGVGIVGAPPETTTSITRRDSRAFRSNSAPRFSDRSHAISNHVGAYGGSLYGHNLGGTSRREYDGDVDRYGGSSYGAPRKMSPVSSNGEYGGSSFHRAGQASRRGLIDGYPQSPYHNTRHY